MRNAGSTRGIPMRAVALALATSAAASCVVEPSREELASQRVVVTQFSPNVDFGSYRTFAVAETVEVLSQVGSDGGSATRTVDPAVSKPFLDAIANELTSRGYRRVGRNEGPDLGVAVNGVVRSNASVTYGAWWGYGSAAPGYWGYGTAGLTSGIQSGVIAIWRSGAIVIELFDLRPARDANAATTPIAAAQSPDAGADAGGPSVAIPVIWSAILYGVIGEVESQQTPIQLVEQAFRQSPYLRTNDVGEP